MNLLEKVEYLIIHHTDRNNDFPLFVKLRHKYFRGWDDIGYHYLIGNAGIFAENGKIYTGRNESFEGAHARGYNKNSLGICLIGDFDKIVPSEKQFEALFSLLERKMKEHHIPVKNILGHSELPNVDKSCPGDLLNMDYVRAMLSS
mgnify:FL=1